MSEEEKEKREVDVSGVSYIRVEIPFDPDEINLVFCSTEKVLLTMTQDAAFSLGSKLVSAEYP